MTKPPSNYVHYKHNYKCAVCGLSKRAKAHNGPKCSRIQQQRNRESSLVNSTTDGVRK